MIEMAQEGGKQMHKALTLSPYYQLALQAGWGCHGDAEGCNWSRVTSRLASECPTQSRSRSVTLVLDKSVV